MEPRHWIFPVPSHSRRCPRDISLRALRLIRLVLRRSSNRPGPSLRCTTGHEIRLPRPCLLDTAPNAKVDPSAITNPDATTDKVGVTITDDSSGGVVALETCPADPNVLLIGYNSGHIFLWDIKSKSFFKRFLLPSQKPSENGLPVPLISVCWKPDGSQFVSSHNNFLAFWNMKEGG
ncbi:hypothetical protein BC829DRAFT_271155 [Chytridium lagenaria]|nr:hypothetical protein BC829DRAFT_271155 [Chytridium lagenaria]